MFQISNVRISRRFLHVQGECNSKCNTIVFSNCRFNDYKIEDDQNLLHLFNVNVYFSNCIFVNYVGHHDNVLISISGETVSILISHCVFHNNKVSGLILVSGFFSNIIIQHSEFNDNVAYIFDYMDGFQDLNFAQTIMIIENTTFIANKYLHSMAERYLFGIRCITLLLMGPVKFYDTNVQYSFIRTSTLISIHKSTITVNGHIEFSQNTIGSLIEYDECATLECFTMNVGGNTTLLITNNTIGTYFIPNYKWDNNYPVEILNYLPCFFQYLNSSTKDETNYLIMLDKNTINSFVHVSVFFNKIKSSMPTNNFLEVRLPITHCYWLPHSSFTTTMPLDVNEKYVKFTNNSEYLPQMTTKKLLCYCINDMRYDCYKDDLGYVYPGQTAEVSFCYPGNSTEVHNVEVSVDINKNGTHFTPCVIYSPTEFIQFIGKKCTALKYTIAFSNDSWCELFLKLPVYLDIKYNIFYVRQLLCPLGFTKEDGICRCYPSFKQFGITDCNINNQTILRPTNIWISATSYSSYHISLHCPFYYCIPYSFYLNLSIPDSQCQFNRSGVLCGQCQIGLSTVFGSSNCRHCSSVYFLLIIPIAIAGIVLVLVLFFFNLTVTDGAINGFILYANIVSINSVTFFPYDQSTFAYVFISLANLDLGIQTCFYNGMDDYAKMWLQLAFPFYLIFIATTLIMASRYSNRIQKVTAQRALPVLATLFLLSYTKILRIISVVLFFYSSITHLPTKHTRYVWSIDPNVPLFGVKYTFLFIVCAILFLILVPFNAILLFTKILSKFKIVTKFRPLLDAYQGPYKIKFYYWTGLQLLSRAIFYGLSSLDSKINFTAGLIFLGIANIVHAYNQPFKTMVKNILESLFIINLLGLHTFILSYDQNDVNKVTAVNILIIVAAIKLLLIAYSFMH